MRVLILVAGSLGDLHPFLGIARALAARGHRIDFCTHETYREAIAGYGFGFHPADRRGDFEAAASAPGAWRPLRGPFVLWRTLARQLRPVYAAAAGLAARADVLVAAPAALPIGRLLEETHGIPLVAVALSPAALWSARAPAALDPGDRLRKLPYRWRRLALWLLSRGLLDPTVGRSVNRFRRELRLPAVRRVVDRWAFAGAATLGLFPAWFAPPQADWPAAVELAGFPLFDRDDGAGLPPELEAFLAAGEAPLVFTPGSAMFHGRAFFAKALQALAGLGRRGIFLTRSRAQLPPLPPSVRHVDYVPLARLLPRAAAIVHHGGIGTVAQALHAGLPQLITPFAYDQFDNAVRVERLGCGLRLPAAAGAAAMGEALRRLLADRELHARCHERRAELADAGAAARRRAAEAIERTGAAHPRPQAGAVR